MRHEIAEPLGGHLDLREQTLPRSGPRGRPTREPGHVAVAKFGETARANGGEPFASVRDDDTSVEPGDQPGDLTLDVAKGQVGREKRMPGAKWHNLAHVEEGNLLAILEHRRDHGS